MVTVLMFVLVILCAAAVGIMSLQNKLVAADQRAVAAWSGIEIQLKRRHDLTPTLVKAAASAMRYEKGIFDSVLEARSAALTALATRNQTAVSAAEADLSIALSRLIAYAESNPTVTATANIKVLQHQLEDTEDQIAAARRYYNSAMENYNTVIRCVPHTYVAAYLGLSVRAGLTFTNSEAEAFNTPPAINI
jgi:LemA protein